MANHSFSQTPTSNQKDSISQDKGNNKVLLKIIGVSKGGVLNLRKDPSTKARIQRRLPADTQALPELERKQGWVRTRFCMVEGWVSEEFVTPQTEGDGQLQLCDNGPLEPFPKTPAEIAALKDPAGVNVEVLETIPRASLAETQSLNQEATTTNRSLGEALLSPGYTVCVTEAGDKPPQITICLSQEQKRWEQDMQIAYNLIASTLSFQEMRKLRDDQRAWLHNRNKQCKEKARDTAKPFTRYHQETCELKLTLERAVTLEERLRSRTAPIQFE